MHPRPLTTLLLIFAALPAACTDPRLAADKGRPEITIEAPPRGATIQANAQDSVALRGRVEPGAGRLGRVTARIGRGEELVLEPDAAGRFESELPARPGVNPLVVEASNSVGRSARAVRAFHYAVGFWDPGANGDRPGSALLGRLADWALDWGSPEDYHPYDPCGMSPGGVFACDEVRDLASLLELALNQADFDDLQPEEQVSLPLVSIDWTLDLLGFAEVGVRIDGHMDWTFQVTDIQVGEAEVLDLSSTDGGLRARVRFVPAPGPDGQTRPGLSAAVSATAETHLGAWLDLTVDDPGDQASLCDAAALLCNLLPPHDCLDEYLESCGPDPRPLASSTSGLDAPVLGSLSAERMALVANLSIGFDDQTGRPTVDLLNLELDLELGALDLSSFEDVTIELGTVQVGGFDIDLGSFHIPDTFLGDALDMLTSLLLDAVAALIEPLLGDLFACDAPDNPVCLVKPFIRDMLAAFEVGGPLSLPGPSGQAPIPIELTTRLEAVEARAFYGIGLTLGGQVTGPADPAVTARRSDGFLGLAQVAACDAGELGTALPPAGDRSAQLAPALDLVNQFFYAAWASGGLDLTASQSDLGLDPELAISHLSMTVEPKLPVLLDPCTGSDAAVALAAGDLAFSLEMTRAGRAFSASGWVSLMVPADLSAEADRVRLRPSGDTWVAVQFDALQVDDGRIGDAERDALARLIGDQLLGPLLTERADLLLAALDSLRPVFDITRLPGVDPAQGQLTLGALYSHVTGGRLVLNADLLPR